MRVRRVRRLVFCLVAFGSILTAALFGRKILALWERQWASHYLKIGAIAEAQRRLEQSARNDPGNGTTDLMQAVCFRLLQRYESWSESLRSAAQKGTPAQRIQRETNLGLIQIGQFYKNAEDQLTESGLTATTTYDAPAAFVYGYLASEKYELAAQLLDAWSADYPNDAHVAYMRGRYWQSQGKTDRAQVAFQTAFALQPRHEAAHVALAEMLEGQDRLDPALKEYVASAIAAPLSESATLGVARISRKQGLLDQARVVLRSLASAADPSPEVALEMARIELVQGNYADADQWFERADLARTQDADAPSHAGTALAMQGQSLRAEQVFAQISAMSSRISRVQNLRMRLASDPRDATAAKEMQQLNMPPAVGPARETDPTEKASNGQPEIFATPTQKLYAIHCRACHGANGDGRAARHLFPPPRDLRNEPCRLISTINGIPTLDDVVNVLRRGIPGTSMQAFEDLSDSQLNLLAQEVRRLRREGLQNQFAEMLSTQGEEIDEDELEETADYLTAPGEIVFIPTIGRGDERSLARGKELFSTQACNSCHGDDGVGAWDQTWFDARQRPIRPRDLAHELFKGGQDAESIYLRIVAGMPGSPHPSSSTLDQEQAIDLVHYCRSLSREPKREFTNYQRAALATSSTYLTALGRTPPGTRN